MSTVLDVRELLESRKSLIVIDDVLSRMTEEGREAYSKMVARLIHSMEIYASPSETLDQKDEEIFAEFKGLIYGVFAV